MPIEWERTRAEQVVQSLYSDLFNRDPEHDVLVGLVRYLVEGRVSIRMQVMRMLKSEEFFDKRLRQKAPTDMARELYHYLLAREPESNEALQGAADFVGKFGWRTQVDIMINSEEYLGRFGDDAAPSATEVRAEVIPLTPEVIPVTPVVSTRFRSDARPGPLR